MVVTMQESFAGIRVDQILCPRRASGKIVSPQQPDLSFHNLMRIMRSMEAVGRWSRRLPRWGSALALLYVYVANLPAAKFIALIAGIFLLYEPIKTLAACTS